MTDEMHTLDGIEHDGIRDRAERAMTEDFSYRVVDTDPYVLVVENADGSSETGIHSIVPEAVHCSCPDTTYRSAICKHLLGLWDLTIADTGQDGMADAVRTLRESLQDRVDEIDQEASELRERLDALQAEGTELEWALDAEGEISAERIDEVVSELKAQQVEYDAEDIEYEMEQRGIDEVESDQEQDPDPDEPGIEDLFG